MATLLGTLGLAIAGCATTTVVDQSFSRSAVGVVARGCSLVDSFGTGVAIELELEPGLSTPAQSFIATSAHTVAGATQLVVRHTDEVEHSAVLVAFDPNADVAILRVDDLVIDALTPGAARRNSAATLVTWNPNTGFQVRSVDVNRLLTVTIEDIYVDKTVSRRGIELNTAVVHGDSGGPVINRDGQLVGIVYATSREHALAYAVAMSEITELAQLIAEQPVSSGPCT